MSSRAESPPQTPSAGPSFTSQRQRRCNPKCHRKLGRVIRHVFILYTNNKCRAYSHLRGERGNSPLLRSYCVPGPPQTSPCRARTLPRRWFSPPCGLNVSDYKPNMCPAPMASHQQPPSVSPPREFLVPLLNQLSRRFQNIAQVAEIESNCPLCSPLLGYVSLLFL